MPRRLDETPLRSRSGVLHPELPLGTPPRPGGQQAGVLGRSLQWILAQFNMRGTSQSPNLLDLTRVQPVLEVDRPPLQEIGWPDAAAGDGDVTLVMPAEVGVEWELIGLTFRLRTDANVANRLVRLDINPGSGFFQITPYIESASNFSQAAGATGLYCVSASGVVGQLSSVPTSNVLAIPVPLNLRLMPLGQFRLLLINGQVGDILDVFHGLFRKHGATNPLPLINPAQEV